MKTKFMTVVSACLVAASVSLAPVGYAQTAAAAKVGSIVYAGFEGAPLNLTEQVAIEKGMFAAYGLEVKFVGATSGQQMVSALMGGSAQIGVLTTSATAPLIRQGQCFQFLTSGARTYYNLIAQPDLKLPHAGDPFPANLVDLKGKKIGINARGTAMEFMMDAILKQAGISPSEVTYIATGGAPTAVTAFRNRQVEVLMDFPIAEQLLKPNEFQNVARLMDLEKNNPIHHLAQVFSGTSCDYAKANPAVIAAFCSAVGDAYRYVNNPANKAGVVAVVQKTLSIDQATAESFWQQYNGSWPTPKIDTNAWNAQKILLPSGTNLPGYAEYVSSACQAKL